MKLPISVIILTYNEEKNIEACLQSVIGLTNEIFIVDSYSIDKTIKLAKNFTDKIFEHPFENYSAQRNWALQNLSIRTDWILNIDADHRITPELINELEKIFKNGIPNSVNGFLISRRTIFMDRWIKHGGHYPTYHANFFRKGFGKCEERLYDQHFLVQGKFLKLKNDIIDIVTDSLTNFTSRHNKWATFEAVEQLTHKSIKNHEVVLADIKGNSIEKRRALRNYYDRAPIFIRPFLYFFVRYFLRLGFLDGKEGFIFHF